MRFVETEVPGVIEVDLDLRSDDRGWFGRIWCEDEFAQAGLASGWVQANQAHNPSRHTLRGLHLQRSPHGEAKYVRCTRGALFDVAVDARPTSATFRAWVGRILTADEANGLYIPPGFAHGYLTLAEDTDLVYLTSRRYEPDAATGLRYDDPDLGIVWPAAPVRLSQQDRTWPLVADRSDL